ncbi:unnamed protein product [Hapterophycus canaliculatus]
MEEAAGNWRRMRKVVETSWSAHPSTDPVPPGLFEKRGSGGKPGMDDGITLPRCARGIARADGSHMRVAVGLVTFNCFISEPGSNFPPPFVRPWCCAGWTDSISRKPQDVETARDRGRPALSISFASRGCFYLGLSFQHIHRDSCISFVSAQRPRLSCISWTLKH